MIDCVKLLHINKNSQKKGFVKHGSGLVPLAKLV